MKKDVILYQIQTRELLNEYFNDEGLKLDISAQEYSFENDEERDKCYENLVAFISKIAKPVKETLYPFFKKYELNIKAVLDIKAIDEFTLLLHFTYEGATFAVEFRKENLVLAIFNPDGKILVTRNFDVFDMLSEFAEVVKLVNAQVYNLEGF